MKKILIYGFYLLGAAALLAGCIKDEVADPAPVSGEKLTLQMPDAQEVAITRAATEMECKISSMYLLVYRSNSLVHKQLIASALVTGNGTAQPSVDLDYKVRTGDKVYVVANYSASIGTSLQELGTGTTENDLSALLVYTNPINRRLTPSAEMQPLYGSVTWSAGSNVCTLVRSRARVSVALDDSGLFSGKTLTYILAGAPEKTSMEVVYNTTAQKYEIPNVDGLGGTWNTEADIDNIIPLTYAIYCAPYPISTDAGGVSVDKNTFDKRRTSLILCATDASDVKEYYRLDFSKQLASTTILGDASNEYLDIDPNTHYAFRIESVKSGGYTTAAEAWKNPGSNIEYTVTVSGDGWKSSTSNGQYLVRSDRDTVFVLKNMAAASDLVRFACQMPDAGQKPGGDLPGSVDTQIVSLVGSDKKTPIPVENMQLCKSDGTPVADNTFDFSGETIPAEGYRLKYISGASMPTGQIFVKVRYGNIDHYIPLAHVVFSVNMPTTSFTYEGKADNTLRIMSYHIPSGQAGYFPCSWTTEFSVDGGETWTDSAPDMIPGFPKNGPGSNPAKPTEFPYAYTFDVAARIPAVGNPHNVTLQTTKPVNGVYDLSTKGGMEAMNTANCYVINAPGTYKLPLVYGNAIKNNDPNGSAYTSTSGGSYILKTFVNHLDAAIGDPYISNNANCAPYDACLIWQDAEGLVQEVTLMDDRQNISFEVPQSTIRQGNAIVAVRDASGRVMWSWHIWVTDYRLDDDLKTVTNYQNVQYNFLPVNIGWCDAETLTYAARSVMVRFTQARTGFTQVFEIGQEAHVDTHTGNQPYFQFGRKDPMLPGIRKSAGPVGDKACYPGEGYAFDMSGEGKVSIGTAIRNPHVFYNYGASDAITDWCATSYYNVWSANNSVTTGNDDKVVKTIYDPSPVGYCVPASNAFTGFTYNGQSVSGAYHGSRYNSPYTSDSEVIANFGWEFYCNKMQGAGVFDPSGGTIFYSASGYRSHTDGTVYNVGSSGYCWSAVPYSLSYGRGLYFYSAQVDPWYNYYRSYGFAVYPVQEK